jgi:heat shock protein HspQ
MQQAQFSIGEIIHHKLFKYRGVIIDVDFQFLGSDEWYDKVAKSRPPKNHPWYHVLVDNSVQQTYVAEQNLEKCDNPAAINHPLITTFFSGKKDAVYQLKLKKN